MNGDTFTSNKNSNIPKTIPDDDNFFLNNVEKKQKTSEINRHLNDYDYNLLKEDAYKDVTDEVFKLEYKISKAENEIKDLDAKIQAAKDIRDFNMAEALIDKKKLIQSDLKNLVTIYNDKSLSSKISGEFSSKIKNKIDNGKNVFKNIFESFISILPEQFSSVLEIKHSLNKLKNISQSVDELISMQIPYGEAPYRYDQLSKYIVKANMIQAELSKFNKK